MIVKILNMRYLRIIILSVLLLMSMLSRAESQSRYRTHLGSSIPLSNFGIYGINYVMADPILGINVGGFYSYGFSSNDFGFFAGIDFMYNGIDKVYKETVEEWSDFLDTSQPKYHAYYNIPFSTGLIYDFIHSDNLMLTCNAGLTINFLHVSDLDIGRYKYSSDNAMSFGGKIGVSMVFKEKISINLDYYGLGSHNVLSTSRTVSNHIEEFNKELNVQLLTLTIGVNFGRL